MPKQLKIVCFLLSRFEEKREKTHVREQTRTPHCATWLTVPTTLELLTTLALITAMASGQCPIGLEILLYNLRTMAGSQRLCFPALRQTFLLAALLHVFYYRPGAVKVNQNNG